MITIIILIAALLPAVLLLYYIWKKDPQSEPGSWLARAVLWGIAICIPVTFVELGLQAVLFGVDGEPTSIIGTTIDAFVVAALPEEALKLLALWLVLRKNPFFDEHFDGIVYAVFIGLGFAAIENVGYVFTEEDWVSVAITRALLAVPGHYAFAVLMGYYYSLNHFDRYRAPGAGWKMWAFPVLAHGIYDTIAMLAEVNAELSGVITIAILLLVFRMVKWARKRMEEQLIVDATDIPEGIDEQ